MRSRLTIAAGLVLPAGCTSMGATTAEVLGTPFPARLTAFHVVVSNYCNADGCGTKREHHCDDNGCEIGFWIKITNPTDRQANVQECNTVFVMNGSPPRQAQFSLNRSVAGLGVGPGATRRAREISGLPLSYAEMRRLPESVDAMCQGLDWHDTPPI